MPAAPAPAPAHMWRRTHVGRACMHAWYEWHAWLPAEFAHGELFEILEDDQSLPEEVVQGIAKQLVRALHYLHSNRIIHR